MARQFFKQQRNLFFDDRGSIRLSEIEQNAYRNILTFEAIEVIGFRYQNFKYNPFQSFYGYATFFEGNSVVKTEPLNFINQRLFDTKNYLLWHQYQQQELAQFVLSAVQSAANYTVGELADLIPEPVQFVLELIDPANSVEQQLWDWVLSLVTDETAVPDREPYTALPVDTPHFDAVKINCDLPIRFALRLDSWFLVNPIVYIVGSDVDSSEPKYGGSENPDGGGTGSDDGGSYGDGNQSNLDPGSPPGDGGLGGIPASQTEEGKQYRIIYNFAGRTWSSDGTEQNSFNSRDQTFAPLDGPVGNPEIRLTGQATYGPSNYELTVSTGGNFTQIIRTGSSGPGYVQGTVGAFNVRFEEI